MTTPEYSFIRMEDDEINCADETLPCLPVNELSDLRFQIDAGFNQFEPTDNFLIAVPCDTCDILSVDDLVGDEFLPLTNSGGDASITLVNGFVQFEVEGFFAVTPVAGQLLFINGETSGRYRGWHYITAVVEATLPDVTLITTSTVSDGGSLILGGIPDASYVSLAGIDSKNFQDYVWDFNKPLGELPYSNLECFRLCFYKVSLSFGGYIHACQGTSNCLVKTNDLCFTTKITYGNDEDSFGFIADDSGYQNSVRLPMYLSRPQYPGKEKGYQFWTGRFKKLSERRNKTWLLKTDWMIEQWHERLVIALACDNVQVTNEAAGLTDENIYKEEEYKIGWDEADFDRARIFAPGSVVVFKQLFETSVNSNCG